ncbi:DUF928 domain-containing protein [Leptothoe sp. PORK10 BA2]|uniref:DUF928 domain-containing protein n=1 Tax=Leptothoe sp. PORK10 BA2 TaxID=3110254 RepID=UPI002B211071|nr:DUF928 domain-containing protein [Leptothoe sp. PORK10 BA2]MEA5462541.1 DUF928 domain-containing protein [Leptothoe sp. PORK10 BA2]
MKSPLYLCLTLLGALFFGSLSSSAVQADDSAPVLSSMHVVASPSRGSVLFEPPTDDRVDNSRGGASRPTAVKCIQDDAYGIPLTALIPQSGVGLTVAPHPTLLVYVPPTQATQAHLTLRDEDQRGLYQSQIAIPRTGGVLRIELPADSPELAMGQTYDWSLALLCQPAQTDIPIVQGQIRRVAPADGELSAQSSLLSKAIFYGHAGVWHDMLVNLAILRQSEPGNSTFQANWAGVLQAENLGAIANTPLLN